jgi:hypothetical protein
LKKVTLTTLSSDLNMSYNGTVKKVQKLLLNLKLKDKIKLSDELNEQGRKVKTVVLAEDLYNKLLAEHAKSIQPIEQKEIYENSPVQSEIEPVKEPGSNPGSGEFMEKLVTELIDTRKQLINYAEQVGQIRLLTDNLMTREQDAKYWQGQYFKINFELEKVKLENEVLKKKLEKRWWKPM